jgi:hypothetical protein
MKPLWFLPLAYVADVQGFGLFASYVALLLATVYVVRVRRRGLGGGASAPQPLPVRSGL